MSGGVSYANGAKIWIWLLYTGKIFREINTGCLCVKNYVKSSFLLNCSTVTWLSTIWKSRQKHDNVVLRNDQHFSVKWTKTKNFCNLISRKDQHFFRQMKHKPRFFFAISRNFFSTVLLQVDSTERSVEVAEILSRALTSHFSFSQKFRESTKDLIWRFFFSFSFFLSVRKISLDRINYYQCGKFRNTLSPWKKKSSNQLFSNFISKTVDFTKFLSKAMFYLFTKSIINGK